MWWAALSGGQEAAQTTKGAVINDKNKKTKVARLHAKIELLKMCRVDGRNALLPDL